MTDLDLFKSEWKFTRALTLELLDSLTDAELGEAPGPDVGPFWKQFRHVGRLQECYQEALNSKKIRFDYKNKRYRGGCSKNALRAYLRALDRELVQAVERVDWNATIETFYDGCQVPPNFLCRLAHHLPGDVSQVVILVIRFMVSPHHENNLEPLRSQSSQRLMLAVTFSPLIAIVLLRPLRSLQRVKGKPIHGLAQMLVTGKSKLNHTAFATGLGDKDSSPLSLKVPKGVPTLWSVAQLSPNARYRGAAFSADQLLGDFSCRHSGEKTLNLLAVAVDGFNRGLQLHDQHCQKLGLGSDHMCGNRQLRFVELVPKLATAGFTEVVVALGKALPATTRKLRESLRGRIGFEKIQRDLRVQTLKDLQGNRILFFKRYPDLAEQPGFLPPQPLVIPSQHLKLLALGGIGLK